MDIITGYTGVPHVTAEQDRDINIGIFGNESYILPTGSQLKAEVSSNNEIKVRDGVVMHQGCAASIKKNTYDSLTIANGSQGMKRVDLIVARYSRDQSANVESLTLKVIQGTPAESNPTVPEYTSGDIQAGDLVADMPLYQVIINGLNITEVKKVFTIATSLTELNSKLSVYVLEEKECSPKDTGENQWKYRKWSNGSVEIWRIGGNVDTFTVSRSSANGIYYSDEIVWYPIDMPLKITKIDQILATIDRKGNDGLPNVNIVNAFTENGCPFIKFIITANRTGQFKVSTNFYIQARWK
ncbi:MAG: hypothetical protein ACLUBO_11315 [Coprococcus sp.]